MQLRTFVIPGLLAATLGGFAVRASARVLRVCADPDYLPYSNRAGEGFENKIAEAVAKALGATVEYTSASYRGRGGFPQFLATTLDANKCDVVMNIPYGSREELTTRPYYISSYVFVFKKSKNYDVTSMDSPILKRLKVGFERDTPVEDGMKMRGLIPGAVAFDVGDDNGESPVAMLKAVETGKVDVLITWEPAIGGFLHDFPDLAVVPVPNERALGPPEQYSFPMSMGVRDGDEALKNQLDEIIVNHQAELAAILKDNGVRLYTP
ncbi:MAG TPA: transporter substrate-binding domain-containing protein [Candidatus Polarisedimenticolia bacterium]|nr:transporter substrate-binding domain-containing protein [Candidatus Polarisedimenticolia bacterium]